MVRNCSNIPNIIQFDKKSKDSKLCTRGIWTSRRPTLVVQNASKTPSLVWKASGHRSVDGWFYGLFGQKGFDESKEVAYVYQNMELGIIGQFRDSKLVQGTARKITAYRWNLRLADKPSNKEVVYSKVDYMITYLVSLRYLWLAEWNFSLVLP